MIVFYSSQSVTRKIVQYCAVDSELILRLSFTTCLKMNQLEIFLSLSTFVLCVSSVNLQVCVNAKRIRPVELWKLHVVLLNCR